MTKIQLISASELMATMDHEDKKEPVVNIDWVHETVDIFGGESGYIKDDPYWIGFRDANADWWLFQLAEKNWATPMLIARLDKALRTVREKTNG